MGPGVVSHNATRVRILELTPSYVRGYMYAVNMWSRGFILGKEVGSVIDVLISRLFC